MEPHLVAVAADRERRRHLHDTTGQTISVDIAWEGAGPLEIDQHITSFPGRSATFVGGERDAVATVTVVLNGKTLVDGSTTNASIESLDDHIVETT